MGNIPENVSFSAFLAPVTEPRINTYKLIIILKCDVPDEAHSAK